MFAYDANGDGRTTSSRRSTPTAGPGVVEQVNESGRITSRNTAHERPIEESKYGVAFTQPHALASLISTARLKDIIAANGCGHMPQGDIEPNERRCSTGSGSLGRQRGATFVPHRIDDKSALACSSRRRMSTAMAVGHPDRLEARRFSISQPLRPRSQTTSITRLRRPVMPEAAPISPSPSTQKISWHGRTDNTKENDCAGGDGHRPGADGLNSIFQLWSRCDDLPVLPGAASTSLVLCEVRLFDCTWMSV